MESYIFITGASSGLGRELAIELSKSNNLILNGRNAERLEQTKNECASSHDIMIWQHDLEQVDSLEKDLKQWIQEHEISVSGYVHCAGYSQMVPCRSLTVDVFTKLYSTNVFSAALIVKVLSAKRVNKDTLKSVVFVSSNVSNRGAKAFSIYGSSKAALDGLMRCLSVELAPKVRVNSVLPGAMVTTMTKEIFEDEEMKKKFDESSPLGMGNPQSVVPMIEFLLSDGAAWITGQQFTVDGGRTIDISE